MAARHPSLHSTAIDADGASTGLNLLLSRVLSWRALTPGPVPRPIPGPTYLQSAGAAEASPHLHAGGRRSDHQAAHTAEVRRGRGRVCTGAGLGADRCLRRPRPRLLPRVSCRCRRLPTLPTPPLLVLWRSKALGGGSVDVPSLDKRVLRVPLKEVVRPGYVRVVSGEGARGAGLRCACAVDGDAGGASATEPRRLAPATPALPTAHLRSPAPAPRRHAQQQERAEGRPAPAL